jgi:hypothetical protein
MDFSTLSEFKRCHRSAALVAEVLGDQGRETLRAEKEDNFFHRDMDFRDNVVTAVD